MLSEAIAAPSISCLARNGRQVWIMQFDAADKSRLAGLPRQGLASEEIFCFLDADADCVAFPEVRLHG